MKIIDRRIAVIAHDAVMVFIAWESAWLTRFNFDMPADYWQLSLRTFPAVLLIQSLVLWKTGLYRGLWRFASIPDLWNIIRAVVIGTLAVALGLFLFNRLEGVPRSVFGLFPLLLIFLLGAPRLFYRVWKDHNFSLRAAASAGERVLVIGAGRAGEMLVREMLRDTAYQPIGFLDDGRRLRNAVVHGVPVLGGLDRLPEVVRAENVECVVIAMPSASNQQMQAAVQLCEQSGVPFRTLPRIEDMMSGQVSVNALREVSIDDLLGREKVELDWDIIHKGIAGRTVLVSGGGGSIGAELCRQIARLGPARLVVFERSEFNLFNVERGLKAEFPALTLHACLGDVCDRAAVGHVMARYRPQVVFHAAAYKHVPMLQTKVREAVRNNVLGTKVLAEAADQYACDTFVLISTDKAVNPVNVMGASKRLAEIFCENFGKQATTCFITVRFGNVLGSAGSVVPLFREQIEAGGPVTVTHPDITRFFMTIPEACQLILQAGAMGRGGEIFVLDMGEPVKISFLAEQMVRLSGKTPGEDIRIEYTGLRPGEKMYEELFHRDESLAATGHDKILLARHRAVSWGTLSAVMADMERACNEYDEAGLMALMRGMIPELGEPEDIPDEPDDGKVVDLHGSRQ